MRIKLTSLAIIASILSVGAMSGTPSQAQGLNPCPYTNDGDCDEPNGLNSCAWGTDVNDCSPRLPIPTTTTGGSQTYSYGDRILYRQADSSADGAWYRPGVFWDMRGDNIRFDYARGDQAFALPTHVRPFNWVIGTEISCREYNSTTGESVWTAGVISAITMGNGETSQVTIQEGDAALPFWSREFRAYACSQWLN